MSTTHNGGGAAPGHGSWQPGLRESYLFDRNVIAEIQRSAREGIYDIRGVGAKRHVPHFDVVPKPLDAVTLGDPLVNVDALEAQFLPHKTFHDFWSFDQHAVRRVGQHLGASFAHDFGAAVFKGRIELAVHRLGGHQGL